MKSLFCGLYGLALGSFANVYFYRLSNNISLLNPSSFCPTCNHPIPWKDNIPILSFLLLSGRCRFCSSKISYRYPTIELLCSVLFLGLSIKFKTEPLWMVGIFSIFAFILFLIGGIDWFTYHQLGRGYGIIPDHLPIALSIAGLLFMFQNPFFGDKYYLSLIGGLSGFALMLSIRLLGSYFLKKEALGVGDLKVVGSIGFWLGWEGVLITVLVSSIVGSVSSLLLMRSKKLDRSSSIPYAPFLSLGALCALFWM